MCSGWSGASLAGIVAAISTLGHAGINWACAAVGLVFVLRTLAGMWMVRRQDGLLMSTLLLPMTRPLAASLAMAAGVTAARLALVGLTPPIRLLVEIAFGATIYVAGALLGRAAQLQRGRPCAPLGAGGCMTPPSLSSPSLRILSLSTEFPNPSEPGKGLFVRSRLDAVAARACVFVVAPIAWLDYANPQRNLFAAHRIPREREEGHIRVLHPRWLYPPYGGWANAFFLFARLLPALARLRTRLAFEVIDAHFAHPEGIAAVLLGRILDLPVLVTLRGSELRYRRQRSKRFWMSWALRRANCVIAVSDGLRELAIALGVDPRRVKTVPNGINADVFFRRDRRACRANHGIAAADRIILSAGDLAELKGHHRVIAAVKSLSMRAACARGC